MHSSGFFRIKLIARLILKREISGSHTISDQSLTYLMIINCGLKAAGVPSCISAGIQHHKLKNYADLNHLLGRDWHFRGLNANGDYGYAVLDTIDFYIRKCRALSNGIYAITVERW